VRDTHTPKEDALKPLLILLAVLAALAATGALGTETGAAAGAGGPFKPQIVVPNYESGGGASGVEYSVGHTPFATSLPRLGHVAVDGTIFECNSGYTVGDLCPVPTASFDFSFVTKTGDYLRVAGHGPTGTPGPWTVVGGTGRFADAAGSGTLSYHVDTARHVLTLSFDGVLRLH
jgi:hypothetical protein